MFQYHKKNCYIYYKCSSFFYQNFNVNIITNEIWQIIFRSLLTQVPLQVCSSFFLLQPGLSLLLLYILQRGSIALTLTSYQMIPYILLSKEHYLVKSRSQHSSRTGDPQSSFSTSSVTSNPNVLYNLLAVACALTVHKIAFL